MNWRQRAPCTDVQKMKIVRFSLSGNSCGEIERKRARQIIFIPVSQSSRSPVQCSVSLIRPLFISPVTCAVCSLSVCSCHRFQLVIGVPQLQYFSRILKLRPVHCPLCGVQVSQWSLWFGLHLT